jgi:SLT domain-containing protein
VPDGFRIASAYVDVEIDQARLDEQIGVVEAKLAEIKDRAVGVSIDQQKLDATIAVINARLAALHDRSINVGINKAEFDAEWLEIMGMIEVLQKEFNIQVNLDGISTAITDVMLLDASARATAESFEKIRDVAAELGGINFILGAGGGGWTKNWAQWLHWILAAGAELAAVVVPAAVALGGAAADAAQGVQMAAQHMTSLWTASEATTNMFHKTLGEALGIGNELQRAQNMANPMVYQAMGAAIEVARMHTVDLAAEGLKIIGIFDTFLAKVQYDLSAGGAGLAKGLLGGMTEDAVEIARIFGNLGDAIVHLAADMPGLVHVLLAMVDGVIELIKWFSELPKPLVMAIIVIEEFYRWGGLFITLFARMGAAISGMVLGEGIPLLAKFGEYFSTILGTAGSIIGSFMLRIGAMVGSFGEVGGAADKAGGAIGKAGVEIGDAANSMGPGLASVVVIGAAAFGFLAYKIMTAKTATEEWISSLNAAIQSTSNFDVIDKLAKSFEQLDQQMDYAQESQKSLNSMYDTTPMRGYGEVAGIVTQRVSDLNTEQKDLLQTTARVGGGIAFLEKTYGTSYIGALALAQMANVHLADGITGTSEAADINRLKIADLVAGYQAMGQPAGIVGRDMTALAIQAGEQATKVSELNQAWDAWMQSITGGTSNLGSFTQGLTNLTNITDTSKFSFSESMTGMSLSTKKFAESLNTAGSTGAQAWQNLDQIIGSSAPQLIDWLREAGSEGELSGGQFTKAIKDMVAEMIPFVGTNKTAITELDALAQQAGGPTTDNLTTLTKWLGNTHDATKNLQEIIDSTTQKMGNMAQVAQNLGNVMAQDIIAQMDAAKLKVDNVQQATENYTNSLQKNGAQSNITRQDYQNLVQLLTNVTGNNKQANTIAETYARSLGDDSEAAVIATSKTEKYGQALSRLPLEKQLAIHISATGQWSYQTSLGKLVAPGGSQSTAREGMRIPGYGGGDIFPLLAEPGETVVSKETSQKLAPLFKKMGVPGYQDGGVVGSYNSDSITGLGSWADTEYQDTLNASANALAAMAQQMMAGTPGKGGVATTAQTVAWLMTALKDTKTSSSWLSGLEIIASHESGDNPNAINLTDSNAAAGDPSRGLMQTIMTTFDAYHQAGTSWNIYDPVANAAAAINYIKARYGSVWNVPGVIAVEQGRPYVGYAAGGYIPPGQIGIVGENGPEFAMAGDQGATIIPGGPMRGGANPGGPMINMNYYGPQYPSPQQRAQMRMDLVLALGVAP